MKSAKVAPSPSPTDLATPLLKGKSTFVPELVYDYFSPDVLFHMSRSLVEAYLTLLNAPEADPVISWHAIMEGNVLTQCLGPLAFDQLMRTKGFLSGIHEEHQQQECVRAYIALFQNLLRYHDRKESLSCCFSLPLIGSLCERPIRRSTIQAIVEEFQRFELSVST